MDTICDILLSILLDFFDAPSSSSSELYTIIIFLFFPILYTKYTPQKVCLLSIALKIRVVKQVTGF